MPRWCTATPKLDLTSFFWLFSLDKDLQEVSRHAGGSKMHQCEPRNGCLLFSHMESIQQIQSANRSSNGNLKTSIFVQLRKLTGGERHLHTESYQTSPSRNTKLHHLKPSINIPEPSAQVSLCNRIPRYSSHLCSCGVEQSSDQVLISPIGPPLSESGNANGTVHLSADCEPLSLVLAVDEIAQCGKIWCLWAEINSAHHSNYPIGVSVEIRQPYQGLYAWSQL